MAGEGGRIAIISCHEKVEELLPFTTDETEVVQAINKLPVHPGRQSHWVDGIATAAAMLDARPPLERRAILLISESRDRGSQTPLVDVIKHLQHRAITLHSASFSAYWTAFTVKGNEYRPAAGGGYLDAIVELSRLGKVNAAQVFAEQSGGRQLSFVRLSGLEQLLMQVGQELHRQYLLTYSPAGFSPGAHQIQVTVPGHPELALRHRPQYWLDAPEPPQ